jgi:PAS domain S-box-containing protein
MAQLIFSGYEIPFSPDDIIVSKTDTKGNLSYVNQTFCVISGYKEIDLLGKPHSIIRHDNMPRCIFKLIWEKIQTGREVFGYVVNRTIDGDYYWVLAHVTPSFDENHKIVGYHSNRRAPEHHIVSHIICPLYAELLDIENSFANRKDGLTTSYAHLMKRIAEKDLDYDEFILTL